MDMRIRDLAPNQMLAQRRLTDGYGGGAGCRARRPLLQFLEDPVKRDRVRGDRCRIRSRGEFRKRSSGASLLKHFHLVRVHRRAGSRIRNRIRRAHPSRRFPAPAAGPTRSAELARDPECLRWWCNFPSPQSCRSRGCAFRRPMCPQLKMSVPCFLQLVCRRRRRVALCASVPRASPAAGRSRHRPPLQNLAVRCYDVQFVTQPECLQLNPKRRSSSPQSKRGNLVRLLRIVCVVAVMGFAALALGMALKIPRRAPTPKTRSRFKPTLRSSAHSRFLGRKFRRHSGIGHRCRGGRRGIERWHSHACRSPAGN